MAAFLYMSSIYDSFFSYINLGYEMAKAISFFWCTASYGCRHQGGYSSENKAKRITIAMMSAPEILFVHQIKRRLNRLRK